MDVVDADSPCAQLVGSYPSEHGLVVFTDDSSTVRAIPLCFPGVSGRGLLGRNLNVAVPRAGTLSITITDVRPAIRFGASSIAGHCRADNTGKSIVPLGAGPSWSLPVDAGHYCITLITETMTSRDTWFTLTVTRP